MSEMEKLKAQNAALADRIAKLEEAAKPAKPAEEGPPYVHQPPDYTAGMTMGRSAMQAMSDALPSSFYSDLRADARRSNPTEPSSPTAKTNAQRIADSLKGTSSAAQSEPPRQRGTGFVEPRPLEPPPGVALADRLMDVQDAKDRAELIERELKLAKARMGKGDAG
jgi:hypothetical protein